MNLALATVTVEIDDKVVKEADVIFDKLGIDMEAAINLFCATQILCLCGFADMKMAGQG